MSDRLPKRLLDHVLPCLRTLALVLGLGAGLAVAQEPVSATDAPTQQVASGELIDRLSAFALRAPSDEWRLLDATAASAVVPQACAGLTCDADGVLAVLVVIHWPTGSLERGADHLVEQGAFEIGESVLGPLARRTVVVPGADEALRLRWRTREAEGELFRRGLLLARRGAWIYAFDFIASEPETTGAEGRLAELDDVLRLLPELEPRPRLPSHSVRGEDLESIVEEGVVQHLASGFVLRTPAGWRLLDRGTTFLEHGAVAHFLAEDGLTTCTATAVPRADDEEAQISEQLPSGATPSARRELEIAGFRAFRWSERHPTPEQARPAEALAVAWLLLQGPTHALRLVAETRAHSDDARLADQLVAVAAEVVATIDDAQRSRRLDELAARRDRDPDLDFEEQIGASCSLRLGVFEDFEHGFRLRRPTGRWPWQIGFEEAEDEEEDELEMEEEGAIPRRWIWLRAPGLGLEAEIVVTRSRLDEHAFQGSFAYELASAGRVTALESLRELELGGRSFLSETCAFRPEADPEGYRPWDEGHYLHASALLRDELYLSVRLHGAARAKPQLEEALRAILGGLEIDPAPRALVEETERGWIDRRVGLRFEAVAERWKPQRQSMERGEGKVAAYLVSRGLSQFLLLASHFPDQPPARRSALELGELESFLDELRDEDLRVVPLPAATSIERVSGFPAQRRTYALRSTEGRRSNQSAGNVISWQLWRGCTCYTLLLIERSIAGGKSRYADAVLPGFELLPPGR